MLEVPAGSTFNTQVKPCSARTSQALLSSSGIAQSLAGSDAFVHVGAVRVVLGVAVRRIGTMTWSSMPFCPILSNAFRLMNP